MITCEAAFYPTGTIQTIVTNESEFANAFYEVALRDGYEIEAQVLAGGVHQLVFACDDAEIGKLFQAAYVVIDGRFWAEENALQVLAGAE